MAIKLSPKQSLKLLESKIAHKLPSHEDPRNDIVRMSALRYETSKIGIEAYKKSDNTLNYRTIVKQLLQKELEKGATDTPELRLEIAHTYLKAYKKAKRRLVQTPHPTETHTREASAAEARMLSHMSKNFRHFVEIDSDRTETREKIFEEFVEKSVEYRDAITPPSKNIIDQEMQNSYIYSEYLYTSLRHELASNVRALREELGVEIVENGSIKSEFLPYFSHMLEVHTWSPGDADGKRAFTYAMMVKGDKRQVEAMNRKYLEELGSFASQLEDRSDAKKQIHTIMWKLIETISRQDGAVGKLDSFSVWLEDRGRKEAAESIRHVLNQWNEFKDVSFIENKQNTIRQALKSIEKLESKPQPLSERNQHQLELLHETLADSRADYKRYTERLDTLIPGFDFSSYDSLHYSDDTGLSKDLERFRDTISTDIPAVKVEEGININLLDLTLVGSYNFGERAQKAEYRQSVHAFEIAFNQVIEHLRETSVLDDLYSQGLLENIDNVTGADLLRIMNTDNPFVDRIRETIYSRMTDLKYRSEEILKLADNEQRNLTWPEQQVFYFEDILKRLRYISDNPKAYPIVLLAECRSADELFMVQAMADIISEKRRDGKPCAFKIWPLQEYVAQIRDTTAIPSAALANEFFKAAQPDFLTMLAGSDSMKTAASAALVLIAKGYKENKDKNFIEHLYLGTGSALHRASITLAAIRTRQGLEMRIERPTSIAADNEKVKSLQIRAELGLPAVLDTIPLDAAVINLGNYLDLKGESDELWADIVITAMERLDEYEKKYESKAFANFVDDCLPSVLEKANSFADRPPYRSSHGEENGNPEIGPEKMRAIGYGQSLNNAGWGAVQLYYDISETLINDSNAVNPKTGSFTSTEYLKQAGKNYMESPIMQDLVNRAVVSLATSNVEQAWKFTEAGLQKHFPGLQISYTKVDGESHITISNGTSQHKFNMHQMLSANGLKHNEQLMPVIAKMMLQSNPGLTQTELNQKAQYIGQALQAAAFTNLEHDKATRSLTEMFCHLKKGRLPKPGEDLIQIMGNINEFLGEELKDKKKIADQSRDVVLDEFRRGVKNNKDLVNSCAHTKLREIYELPLNIHRHSLAYTSLSPDHDKGLALAN